MIVTHDEFYEMFNSPEWGGFIVRIQDKAGNGYHALDTNIMPKDHYLPISGDNISQPSILGFKMTHMVNEHWEEAEQNNGFMRLTIKRPEFARNQNDLLGTKN